MYFTAVCRCKQLIVTIIICTVMTGNNALTMRVRVFQELVLA